MKALAINGSPRRSGNTETMFKKVLEPSAMKQFPKALVELQ